ncbi:unnamed protein product [Vitrella brassicaformis CCMP3155]|uniref:EamA domain-containing protein n=1 Tax=Vitrella brassicaformis (strain CCMP3155) TaxID=1169540 RepID=A0A0G4GQ02_VITBC|nr:unnamed protein product [Vitrella brassicaformis CCMP3155]|eukprot:CEM32456.1 unnamed protein product [Vitrella brassicaformis CCMP3155]
MMCLVPSPFPLSVLLVYTMMAAASAERQSHLSFITPTRALTPSALLKRRENMLQKEPEESLPVWPTWQPPSSSSWVSSLERQEEALTTLFLDAMGEGKEGGSATPKKGKDWSRILPRALIFFIAFLYGTNFGAVKIIGEEGLTSIGGLARFSVSALVLLPFMFKKGIQKGAIRDGFLAGVPGGLGYVSQALSLQFINANTCAFFCSLSVVIIPFLEALRGKTIQQRSWVAALLAASGVGLLELPLPFDFLNAGSATAAAASTAVVPPSGFWASIPFIGEGLALLQAVGFAVCYIMVEDAMQEYDKDVVPYSAALTIGVAAVAGAYTLREVFTGGWETGIGGLAWGQIAAAIQKPTVLLAIFWTGVVTTALTILGENWALQRVSATEMSLILTSEPLWAAMFSALLLGEMVTPRLFLGGFFIVLACLIRELPFATLFSYLPLPFFKKRFEVEDDEIIEDDLERVKPSKKKKSPVVNEGGSGGVGGVNDVNSSGSGSGSGTGGGIEAVRRQDEVTKM